jgi:Cytochrome c3/Class III cytochrome C family
MPQLFSRRCNTIVRTALFGGVIFICLCGWGLHAVYFSPYTTLVNVPISQPVPFSHKHHVGDLGIDCRFCHDSVEKSAFAGLPSTDTCMTCHSQLFTDAPPLAPVRQSLATGAPIRWNRVNRLPDFVFFNHSIHVNKGIGCSTCHGRLDEMPLTGKANTLYMRWCLECHQDPARFIRPHEEVFNLAWQPDRNQPAQAEKLVHDAHINTTQLQDCSICHR